MRALVTGATGFIGSTLVEELSTLGFDVVALLRRGSSVGNLEGADFERVEGSLEDAPSLERAVRDVDYVFHLGGSVAAARPEDFMRVNADGTRRLAEAAARVRPGLTRFVLLSSLAAAGPGTGSEPRREGQDERPVSHYGRSKRGGERALMAFKDLFPVTVLRPPMVYGSRDRALLPVIQAVGRNLMPRFGLTGSRLYSTIHVRDLVRGIAQAALAPLERSPSGETFYLAADGAVTDEELLSTIAALLERSPLRVRVPSALVQAGGAMATGLAWLTGRPTVFSLDKTRELLADYWVCSNEKAKSLLGFAPEFGFSDGMAESIAWYKREGGLA